MPSRSKQEKRLIAFKRTSRRAKRAKEREAKKRKELRDQHNGHLYNLLMKAARKGKTHEHAEKQLGVKVRPGGVAVADTTPAEEQSPQIGEP